MKRLTSLAAILVLSACGGGGGDSAATQPAAAQNAEGFWVGTTAQGTTVNLAVLENGETWGLYGNATNVVGAVYGNTTVSGSTLSGSGTGFNFVTRAAGSGTYTGTVATKGNISMSVSDGTQLTGIYDASYEQPATLANVAGTYNGWVATGGAIPPQTSTVVVDVNGNVTSSFVSGTSSCTTTGTVTPRNGGKNVYNLQLTSVGNACMLASGTTVAGVATYNATSRQVIAMGLNAAKSDGLIFVGVR